MGLASYEIVDTGCEWRIGTIEAQKTSIRPKSQRLRPQ
jgi:hypothetical protein